MVDEVQHYVAKLESLHDDVKAIASYVPKIEIALERLSDMKDVIGGYADTNKEQFRLIRELSEKLNTLNIEMTSMESRIGVLEASRNGVLGMLTPVGTVIIITLLLIVVIFLVSHGIIPAQITNNSGH